MNAWMNGWTDEWLSESMNFADPIFQKCSETLRLLTIFLWNRALATVSCTYYRPRLPKVLQTRQFFAILCEIELSPESRAHFPKPIFQKRSERLSFSTFSSANRALATVLCRSRPQPRKQRPYFGDHGSQFTGKNAEFRAQECFQAWIHAIPTCYTSQLLDGDVVDLMMWLTWWWECCPWQSRKFSN